MNLIKLGWQLGDIEERGKIFRYPADCVALADPETGEVYTRRAVRSAMGARLVSFGKNRVNAAERSREQLAEALGALETGERYEILLSDGRIDAQVAVERVGEERYSLETGFSRYCISPVGATDGDLAERMFLSALDLANRSGIVGDVSIHPAGETGRDAVVELTPNTDCPGKGIACVLSRYAKVFAEAPAREAPAY